jgi:hypothetical protein
VASTIRLTEDDVRNCTWTLDEVTPHYRRYIGHGTHPVTGAEITVQKTEFIAEDELLAQNASDRNETDGRRWSSGIGSDKGGNLPFVPVGRVPLNKFFAEVAPRMKAGDKDFMKWWLSQEENQPFRTRRGNL